MPLIIEGKGYGQIMPNKKPALVTITESICQYAKTTCYGNAIVKPNKSELIAICNNRFKTCKNLIGKKIAIQP